MEKTFENYNALFEEFEELALELLNEKGEGDWQDEEIYWFIDLETLAEYELTGGWYSDLQLEDRDYNGAPNPLDFIDLEEFGNALERTWDEGINFKASNGSVVQTSCGW